MTTSLIIIGAGVAGLTAGCYASMNGYQTTVLEMGSTPGGLCTSWKRKGYLFDGSVAGLAGSAPGSPLYQLWQEIGVAKYCPLHYGENFGSIWLPDGRKVTVYTYIERLEAHLLDVFPAEAKLIRQFTGAIRSVLGLDIPFSDAKGWEAVKQGARSAAAALRSLPALLKYGSMPIHRFADRCSDPALATVFNNLVHFGGTDVPILTVLLPLAYAHRKMAGIPLHGWLSFARAIERRLLELGGKVQYHAKVEKLLVEHGQVKGVLLADGTRLAADRVISAADGRFTSTQLLGLPADDLAQKLTPADLSDQPAQVNIGAALDFSAEHGSMTFILPNSVSMAGREHTKITMHQKYYDPAAAPAGKSAVTVFIDSHYAFWKEALDRGLYEAEKNHCAETVIAILERYYPGFRQCVEVVDVSTPLTRECFTGNWMGAMQARKPNSNMIGGLLRGAPQYAVKGIAGFYMAGQWVEAWGGITTAAQSGRKAVQAMCRHDQVPFTTTIA